MAVNVINAVLNQVPGASSYLPTASATNLGGHLENRAQLLTAQATTELVGKGLIQKLPDQAANQPNFGSAPSMGGKVGGALLTSAVSLVDPMTGAMMGMAMTIKEVSHSVGHFGVEGSKPLGGGELSLATSIKPATITSAASANSESYTDIMGQSWTGEGLPLRSRNAANTPQFANNTMGAKINGAAADVASEMSPEEIMAGIKARQEEIQKMLGANSRSLTGLGLSKEEIAKFDAAIGEGLTNDPSFNQSNRPKGLNVGMGSSGPSVGSSGPSFG